MLVCDISKAFCQFFVGARITQIIDIVGGPVAMRLMQFRIGKSSPCLRFVSAVIAIVTAWQQRSASTHGDAFGVCFYVAIDKIPDK